MKRLKDVGGGVWFAYVRWVMFRTLHCLRRSEIALAGYHVRGEHPNIGWRRGLG